MHSPLEEAFATFVNIDYALQELQKSNKLTVDNKDHLVSVFLQLPRRTQWGHRIRRSPMFTTYNTYSDMMNRLEATITHTLLDREVARKAVIQALVDEHASSDTIIASSAWVLALIQHILEHIDTLSEEIPQIIRSIKSDTQRERADLITPNTRLLGGSIALMSLLKGQKSQQRLTSINEHTKQINTACTDLHRQLRILGHHVNAIDRWTDHPTISLETTWFINTIESMADVLWTEWPLWGLLSLLKISKQSNKKNTLQSMQQDLENIYTQLQEQYVLIERRQSAYLDTLLKQHFGNDIPSLQSTE